MCTACGQVLLVDTVSCLCCIVPSFLLCKTPQGGGIVLNYACQPDASRPTLQKLGGIIASAPMILQPPGYRTGALTLAAGGLVGRLLPSLQLKIPISGEVSRRASPPCRASVLHAVNIKTRHPVAVC